MWVLFCNCRYASVRAIESKSPVDDQQWLTYWVLYSMITLFELTFAKLLEWYNILLLSLSYFSFVVVYLNCFERVDYMSTHYSVNAMINLTVEILGFVGGNMLCVDASILRKCG